MVSSRRTYIRLSALAAAAGCTLRFSALPAAEGARLHYGVQIAGVGKEAAQDLPRLLSELRRIGFTEVELHFLLYDHPAPALRRMVEDAGLHCVAGHFALTGIETKLDYARELGLTYMVAMLPRPRPESLEEYRAAASSLSQAGASVHAHGMQFLLLFHNHEMMPQQGSSGFAQLMQGTDAALVGLELDIYWIVQAGLDPSAFLRKHKHRIKLLHLKDRLAGFPPSYTTDEGSDHSIELGKGTIPWPALLSQARQQGIRYAFLDYDKSAIPILDSLRQSFAYLKSLNDDGISPNE